jgi:chorismate mutase/prephenate dehydratase
MGASFETVGSMPNSVPDTALGSAETDAPASEDGWQGSVTLDLASLRAELDRIDDTLHDLLIERSRVVEQVARSGKPAAFRPGREADIIRRLVGRHSGALPAQTLFRIWRELLAGTTSMQSKVVVAVCDNGPGAVVTQLAREHFGAFTPLRAHGSPAQALNDLASGNSTVAVLPLPNEADGPRGAWWTTLASRTPRLHVIARLPFWTQRAEGAPAAQALVVATTAPDSSTADRSLLMGELHDEVSRDRLSQELAATGLQPELIVLRRDADAPTALALIDIAGHLTDEDARLSNLRGALRRPTVLGGYAEPIHGDRA